MKPAGHRDRWSALTHAGRCAFGSAVRSHLRPAILLSLALAAGCAVAAARGDAMTSPGPHDVLSAAGPQAQAIGRLWNLFLGVCTAVFAAVLVAFAWAVGRSPRADARTPPDLSSLGVHEAGPFRSVVVGVAVSTALLLVLLGASIVTDRALARMSLADAVRIQVTGHQWWWDVRYDGTPESQSFNTANEIHVPVGVPVVVTLRSDDVIHSLWVPSLAGKKDLLPGRPATMQFRADRPGVYRGQCAEFCGFQHAFMAFEIVADPRDRYDAWAAQQRSEAPPPTDPLRARGRDVFLGSSCVLCHAIQGTDANARKGPDLTHVGARKTLAAGTLANTREALRNWIRDPQSFKPGVNMPSSTLPDADLDALVAYLQGLQ